ncbi:FecR family protein [Zhouia sp. PK063]|uniref:FecR family protein n=1 Tax=Zhouia sp. PK063 TaxID=3373602 RepID=UPI00378A5C7F
MMNPEIETALINFLTGNATTIQKQQLSQWVKQRENMQLMEQYIKVHYETTLVYQKNQNFKYDELLKQIDKKSKKKLKVVKLYSYVAAIIVLIGIGVSLMFYIKSSKKYQNKIVVNDAIIIQSANGQKTFFNTFNDTILKNNKGEKIGNKKGATLVYNDNLNDYSINTLTIPNGKQFELILSDGTKIHLNSGSKLSYPANFKTMGLREVTLNGEAYFEVAHDKTRPFIVHSDSLNIQVLGTKFNVNNYPENKNVRTVLVEGSVQLSSVEKEKPTLLNPGYKASWNKEAKNIKFTAVNTSIYTAWMQGRLIFENTPFKRIRKILERKFNVVIVNHNKALDQQLFDASFDEETLDDILKSFQKSFDFTVERTANNIILKK